MRTHRAVGEVLIHTLALFAFALLLLAAATGQPPAPAQPPSTTAEGDTPTGDEAQPPANGEQKEKEEKEPVQIERADFLKYDPEKNIYYLTGNVHFIHKDTHLYCDEAEYNDDEDTARAVGNLKLVQPETTVTGDLMTADFDDEIADVTGNVRLVTKKKAKKQGEAAEGAEAAEEAKPAEGEAPVEGAEGEPAGEEDKPGRWDEHKEKLTTVTCEKLRYWYEEERAIATGNVVAEQEDKTCYADEAEYVEADDLLTIKGNPVKVVMENGNSFQTPWIKAEVEGERFWTGGFSGVFKREKKDEEGKEEEPAAPEQPPSEPPAAPAEPPE